MGIIQPTGFDTRNSIPLVVYAIDCGLSDGIRIPIFILEVQSKGQQKHIPIRIYRSFGLNYRRVGSLGVGLDLFLVYFDFIYRLQRQNSNNRIP